MDSLEHLSLALFDILNEDIGSEKEIRLRRQTMDIQSCFFGGLVGPLVSFVSVFISGSKREGFRISGSDFDIMASVHSDFILLSENADTISYTPLTNLPLEFVCEESSPGFYKLHTTHPLHSAFTGDSFISLQGKSYLRNDVINFIALGRIMNTIIHGPCVQTNMSGDEVDIGVCFKCPFWPKRADPWIRRYVKWPQRNVIERILKIGCHLMGIGSKDSNFHNIEWRISFSMAELELIYSMNHSQFLVYGLLKLFLKDVLNDKGEESLLCSYFMKTAVFWEIQTNPFPWDPCSIVPCFWLCFKRLIKWVHNGFCPNFFIPENNMFRGKIFGSKQELLLCQLLSLYDKGITCLFQTSSMNFNRVITKMYPFYSIRNSPLLQLEQLIELKTFNEIKGFKIFGFLHSMVRKPLTCLKILENIVKYKHTEERKVTIQHYASICFHRLSFTIYNLCRNSKNKLFYRKEKIILTLLTLASKFVNVSEMLYLSMFFYRTKRYEKAVYLLEELYGRLNEPFLLYNDNVNIQKYLDAVGNSSLSVKLRKAVAFDIQLNNESCYIEELLLEQQIRISENRCCLTIPVLVMVHMLRVLVNDKLHNESKKRQALTDLSYLVQYDNGLFIPWNLKDIAWDILGICQLVCREFKNAGKSFEKCLQVLLHVNDTSITQASLLAMAVRMLNTIKKNVISSTAGHVVPRK